MSSNSIIQLTQTHATQERIANRENMERSMSNKYRLIESIKLVSYHFDSRQEDELSALRVNEVLPSEEYCVCVSSRERE